MHYRDFLLKVDKIEISINPSLQSVNIESRNRVSERYGRVLEIGGFVYIRESTRKALRTSLCGLLELILKKASIIVPLYTYTLTILRTPTAAWLSEYCIGK